MSDTLDTAEASLVTESDQPGAPDSDERSRWWIVVGLFGLLGFGLAIAATVIRLPYLVLEPGGTFTTEEYIEADGIDLHPNPDGEVRFVTVTQRRLSPAGWVVSSLQDSDEIFHEEELLRGRTIEEQREENAALMLSSQNNAVAAALIHLGFEVSRPNGPVVDRVVEGGMVDGQIGVNDVIASIDGVALETADELWDVLTEASGPLEVGVRAPDGAIRTLTLTPTDDTSAFLGIQHGGATAPIDGALVDATVDGGPVEDLLAGGDVIVELDGVTITSFEDVVNALRSRRSGDVVTVVAVRDATGTPTEISGEIELGVRPYERIGLSRVFTQFVDEELPFDVDITTEDIGGPSAGLAFTLTVLDVLTPGDLTGDSEIVVTGTIDRAGNVGPIGGVHQKAFAARDAGADLFIVPAANLDEAEAAVDDLRIEAVATLADALELIGEFGGNAADLPTADALT